MAETLGSLCDKLTIVKLKQWHTADATKLDSLEQQATQLGEEIDSFLADTIHGDVDPSRVTFPSNKVFDIGDRTLDAPLGSIGQLFASLAQANCDLWHEQEKVYEVQKNPNSQQSAVGVLQRLGELNLVRTQCIDAIDRELAHALATCEEVA